RHGSYRDGTRPRRSSPCSIDSGERWWGAVSGVTEVADDAATVGAVLTMSGVDDDTSAASAVTTMAKVDDDTSTMGATSLFIFEERSAIARAERRDLQLGLAREGAFLALDHGHAPAGPRLRAWYRSAASSGLSSCRQRRHATAKACSAARCGL